MNKNFLERNLSLMIIIAIALAGCNLPGADAATSPTLGVTQAFQTVEARLTQAALQTPVATMTPSPTTSPPTQTPVPATATSPTTPQPTNTSAPVVSGCDQASPGNPIDVTIPDDTRMQPGQTFTKTWRLVNSGTCTWSMSYAAAFFSGEKLGASDVVFLTSTVAPGQSVDISVDMVAPVTAGTYQGYWKLKNPSDVWFGLGAGEGLPFWVKIIVASSTTTVTPGTPGAPTATATNVIIPIGGGVILKPGDTLNLDTGAVNGGAGDDLNYVIAVDGFYLQPANGAKFGHFGDNPPSLGDCQVKAVSTSPISIRGMGGDNICFQSDAGQYGYIHISGFNQSDGALALLILVWPTP